MRTLIFLFLSTLIFSQEAIIIDHNCTDITKIPERAIKTAKERLHIGYNHTSHGSQLTTGMQGLIEFANNGGKNLNLTEDIFSFNNGGNNGALDLHDQFAGWLDCGTYPNWVEATRNYLNEPGNSDVNVIMWSWCGQVDSKYENGTLWSEYLEPMNQLEQDFPEVTFVYMTGHVDINDDADNKAANDSIRSYCKNNHKVLYDFADIERYDPDGNYYEYVHDNCDYYNSEGNLLGNWATEWQDSHTEGQDWYICGASHSQPLNANQKAYATWWLFAQLGGWNYSDTIEVFIDSTTGYLDDTVSVPIYVKFPPNFQCQSIDIDIFEKSDGLDFIGEDTSDGLLNDNSWTYFINPSDSSVKIAGIGLNYISGSDTLIQLKFKLTRNSCSFEPLIIKSAAFNGGHEALAIKNGGIYIWPRPFFGDVDLDSSVSFNDADKILNFLVELDSLSCQSLANGNVDFDYTISSLDASLILQFLNHNIENLPLMSQSDFFLASGNLSIESQEISPGQEVDIPINIYNDNNIYGFHGKIIYNSEHLVCDSIKWSENLSQFSTAINFKKDTIIFAGASNIQYNGDSNFAILKFNVAENLEVDSTLICLEKLKWNNNPVSNISSCSSLKNKTKIDQQNGNILTTYKLKQNYPNPFNNVTNIEYYLPRNSEVNLRIYNLDGNVIKVLIEETQRKGEHFTNWHAGNISSGIYFCRLKAGGFTETRKMLLIK